MAPVKQNRSGEQQGVVFSPAVKYMAGNPYWLMLTSALERAGVQFHHETPGGFTAGWLVKNRNLIHVLHLHYCQQFYTIRKGQTRFLSVMKFGFNMLLARLLGYRTVFTARHLDYSNSYMQQAIEKYIPMADARLLHAIKNFASEF